MVRKVNKFEQDWRKENPELHMFYVKSAVQHLRTIDKCVKTLSKYSNLNLWDSQIALDKQRAKLVRTNAAYADANEILKLIRTAK